MFLSLGQKAVIRLVGGPADGFVFAVPVEQIPPFVSVGPAATYERNAADGDVTCYRFADLTPHPVWERHRLCAVSRA